MIGLSVAVGLFTLGGGARLLYFMERDEWALAAVAVCHLLIGSWAIGEMLQIAAICEACR